MNGPKIGELFAGYGGLGAGVQMALGGEIAWFSEFDKGPSKILEHRFPGVPNHGDITKINWSQVEPVDILTGGSPCQDLSHAGRRAGMTEGTRSNLWVAMREAVAALRPSLVVWENVRGAYSAEATSGLVDDARLLADTRRRDGEPVLRALGRVLGDLSDLGYDASWHGLRAADVGAPHGRFRVFVVATDTQGDAGRIKHRDSATAADAKPVECEQGRVAAGVADGAHAEPAGRDRAPLTLLGTPTARMWKGSGPVGSDSHTWLLDHGNVEAQVLLLPTPVCGDARNSRQSTAPNPRADNDTLSDVNHKGSWGDYAAAIARWERILGRPAPAPTMTSTKGNPQLSPGFVEWMMGLPAGWVTDVPGITRNEALKALGNGVVPQQAAAALRVMAAMERAA